MKIIYISNLKFLIGFLIILQQNGLLAQIKNAVLSPAVIGTAGGFDVKQNISLEWTLGETFVESVTGRDKWYTQGFHQPLLAVHPTLSNGKEPNLVIRISPNPTEDRLNISFQSVEMETIWLRLIDVTGKTLLNQPVPPRTTSMHLSLKHLPGGLYMLSFISPKGYRTNSFKVIKQ